MSFLKRALEVQPAAAMHIGQPTFVFFFGGCTTSCSYEMATSREEYSAFIKAPFKVVIVCI